MDQERDHAEELDTAMTPFRENMERVASPGYNIDTIAGAIHFDKVIMETTSSGELILSTGLYEAPDGSLWRENES